MIMKLGSNNKQDFEVFLTNATKLLMLAKCHWPLEVSGTPCPPRETSG